MNIFNLRKSKVIETEKFWERTRTTASDPVIKIRNICECKYCGNHEASTDDKCFYCHQYQPNSVLKPNKTIEDGYIHCPYIPIDYKTLHGIEKRREMSFVDIPGAFIPLRVGAR